MERRGVTVAIPLAALLASALLAGCFGTGGKPPLALKPATSDEVPATAPPAVLNEDSCAIVGRVLNKEDTLPLALASVELVGYARSAKTAADGGYSFSLLDPRTYTLKASTFGHFGAQAQVECRAGEEAHAADLLLEGWPQALLPHHETLNDEGILTCSVATGSSRVRLAEVLPGAVGALTPCATNKARLSVQPKTGVPITGMAIELRWEPTSSASQRLALKIGEKPHENRTLWSSDDDYNPTTGTLSGLSPLNVTFRLNASAGSDLYTITPESHNLTYEVNPLPNTASDVPPLVSVITVPQSFDLYVTVFYNNDPVPDCLERGQACGDDAAA